MALKLAIIVALFSIQTLACAKKFTFTKKSDKFYIETDDQHYAIYAKVPSSTIRTVVINKDMITLLRSNCQGETVALSELKGVSKEAFDDLRSNFLKVTAADPITLKTLSDEYTWSGAFQNQGSDGFSLRKLDSDTIVYSSDRFPTRLARVIISRNLIFFVHYDGVLTKEENCLMENERGLIEGVRRIKTEQSKGVTSLFHSSKDNGLKKYLQAHPISNQMFGWFEQEYPRKRIQPVEGAKLGNELNLWMNNLSL